MLKLETHEAQLASVNLRTEKHGQERHLAVDINVSVRGPNTMLDMLEPGLRQSLFRKARKGEPVGDVVDDPKAEDVGNLVAVSHPTLKPITLEGKFPGYELEVLPSVQLVEGKESEPLVLVAVQVKDITVDPIEGGSVLITFKAQAPVEPSDLADLGELLTHPNVLVTLNPPSAQEQQEESE